MTLFATTYRYAPDSDAARDATRPAHRDYLGTLTQQGNLLLSGPYVGGEASALLVFEADTEDAARALTDADPPSAPARQESWQQAMIARTSTR